MLTEKTGKWQVSFNYTHSSSHVILQYYCYNGNSFLILLRGIHTVLGVSNSLLITDNPPPPPRWAFLLLISIYTPSPLRHAPWSTWISVIPLEKKKKLSTHYTSTRLSLIRYRWITICTLHKDRQTDKTNHFQRPFKLTFRPYYFHIIIKKTWK